MRLPDAVETNTSLLLAELDSQLARLAEYFDAPETETALRLIQRSGYSHNLAGRVRQACLASILRGKANKSKQLRMEGVDTIARNLDLVSRLGRRAVRHAENVQRRKLMRAKEYVAPVKQARETVKSVLEALQTRDNEMAVKIGQTGEDYDVFYDRLFRTYTRDMEDTKHTVDLAHCLLTLHEIHRIGEAMQAIGEAVLSINIGQAIKFERFFTLRSVLSGIAPDDDEIRMQSLAETRSGSAISSVSLQDGKGKSLDAVFKDGDRRKVKEERVGVKSWNSVYPGLAPEILSYEKRGDSAALLIEHLDGQTFEDIVLTGSKASLEEAQKALHKTVLDIWRQTRANNPSEMKAMEQLQKRLDDVYRLHPELEHGQQHLQNHKVRSFSDLVASAADREKRIHAPFSVYIHGDFNLDNVIYDAGEKKIRFIDLHRSSYMDYVQDVSVFMVSNYRLQVLDDEIRKRIENVAVDMRDVAAKFARRQKDQIFEYRLALGLARSFASSARFVVDREHAKQMFLRARYILEIALAVPEGKEARFKLPVRNLFRV